MQFLEEKYFEGPTGVLYILNLKVYVLNLQSLATSQLSDHDH